MPLLPTPPYEPPAPFKNGHLHTVYAALFRSVDGVPYARERIDTPDDDFLDLDWSRVGARRLAILSHGLESDTKRVYMLGMARALNRRGWDVLAWNYRGCSGEPNRQLRSYHSGATDDLDVVVQHALNRHGYGTVALVGFSLGGNLTLKYLGERGEALDPRLRRAVTFSVPCDLPPAADHMTQASNRIYLWKFLRSLREKIRAKQVRFPDYIDVTKLERIKTFHDFDERYTAPLHDFEGAADYWRRCSSKPFIAGIRIPTLIVNAADDPFLPPPCYPVEEARAHPCVYLEVPTYGGHLGFIAFNEAGEYWSETRTGLFLDTKNLWAQGPEEPFSEF